MHYNNENLGSNCYEYNVTKLQNWVLKQTNINNICCLMSNFTGIIRELYDLMMNTNINFPGTLKTSRLFLEQLWIIPPWEFWELGLMIQIWFGQGILYTAKVWDCWYIDVSHICSYAMYPIEWDKIVQPQYCPALLQVALSAYPLGVNSGWPSSTYTAGKEWIHSFLKCGT